MRFERLDMPALLTAESRDEVVDIVSNITTLLTSVNISNTSYRLDHTCTLSPQAHAFSTVLSAIVGSIINGLSNGYFAAFFTAWLCWLGTLRLLIVGSYEASCALQSKPIYGGDDFFNFIRAGHGFGGIRAFNEPFFREGAASNPPTVLGWIGWIFSCCYAPLIQVLWLVENWHKSFPGLKVARAVALSVAAIPTTMDTKARYGEALGEKFGSAYAIAFAFATAGSTLLLALVAIIELCLAVKQDSIPPGLIVMYVLGTMFWTYCSFTFASPHDEGTRMNSLWMVLGGLGMGVFGSLFAAGPALGIVANAPDELGVGLSEYLKCQEIAWWQKSVAILP